MRFALLGEHLGHSLSVPIHEAIFRFLGTEDSYVLCPFPPSAFPEAIRSWMETVNGFNITIPYKRAILPQLDGIHPDAEAVGAVNTAVRRGGKWVGYNTDVEGFSAMLRLHGIRTRSRDCWVLGTGGASAAAAFALRQLGARRVCLVSRTPRTGIHSYPDFVREAEGILVNATPAGMLGQESSCPLTEEQLATVLPRLDAVVDLIYNPPETPLLRAAARQGLPYCSGWSMLIAQAVAAERLWQEREIPDDIIPRILKEVQLP